MIMLIVRLIERCKIIRWLFSQNVKKLVKHTDRRELTLNEYLNIVRQYEAPNQKPKLQKRLHDLVKLKNRIKRLPLYLIFLRYRSIPCIFFTQMTSPIGIAFMFLSVLFFIDTRGLVFHFDEMANALIGNVSLEIFLFGFVSILLFTTLALEIIRYPAHKMNLGYDFMLFIDIYRLDKESKHYLKCKLNDIPGNIRYKCFIRNYIKLLATIIVTYAFIYYQMSIYCFNVLEKSYEKVLFYLSYSASSLVMATIKINNSALINGELSFAIITASEMVLGFLMVVLIIADFGFLKQNNTA